MYELVQICSFPLRMTTQDFIQNHQNFRSSHLIIGNKRHVVQEKGIRFSLFFYYSTWLINEGKFCIVCICLSASSNTKVSKTTLLKALKQTQSETGMFHYVEYCSQRK